MRAEYVDKLLGFKTKLYNKELKSFWKNKYIERLTKE